VTKDVLKISQRMDYEEAYAYSMALAGDLTYKQDGAWMKSGIGEFIEGKSRPASTKRTRISGFTFRESSRLGYAQAARRRCRASPTHS